MICGTKDGEARSWSESASEVAVENGNIEAAGCLTNMSEMRCECDHVLSSKTYDSCTIFYRLGMTRLVERLRPGALSFLTSSYEELCS